MADALDNKAGMVRLFLHGLFSRLENGDLDIADAHIAVEQAMVGLATGKNTEANDYMRSVIGRTGSD